MVRGFNSYNKRSIYKKDGIKGLKIPLVPSFDL